MSINEKELDRIKSIQRSINNQYRGQIVDNVNFIVTKLEMATQERDFFYQQNQDRIDYEKHLKECMSKGISLVCSFQSFVANKEREK